MRKVSFLIFLSALAGACAHPHGPAAPALLPVRNHWVTAVDAITGPLVGDSEHVFAPTRGGVVALHRLSGDVAWTIPQLDGTLTLAPGLLIVRGDNGVVTAIDPDTHERRWSSETGVTGRLPALVDGDHLIVAGSGLAEIALATGRREWTAPLTAAATTAPVVGGGCLLLGEADSALRCHGLADGATRWTVLFEHPLRAAPAVDVPSGRLVVGTADRTVVSLKLATGAADWRFKVGAAVAQAPTVWGEYVLVAANDAVLYAFDRSGGQMHWRAPLPSRPLSAPMVVERQAIVACAEHELVAVDVRTGKSPIRSETSVARLDPSAGRSELRTPPLLIERTAYVGVRNPWAVIALEPGTPPGFPPPPALDSDEPLGGPEQP